MSPEEIASTYAVTVGTVQAALDAGFPQPVVEDGREHTET